MSPPKEIRIFTQLLQRYRCVPKILDELGALWNLPGIVQDTRVERPRVNDVAMSCDGVSVMTFQL